MQNHKGCITAITCTRGRHSLLEKTLGYILSQDYKHLLYYVIFNNSPTIQELAEDYSTPNKKIILVNQYQYSQTQAPYTSMDQIFSDAMLYVPRETEVVTFFDDDDVFLPSHISEGMKGYYEAKARGKLAYKPYYSLIQTKEGIEKIHNMAEPSFFVNKKHIDKYGFNSHSSAYHHQWINPLLLDNLLHSPIEGASTFIYQWVGGVFHISGDGENPDNLKRHNDRELDEGDGIITAKF